MLAGLGQYNDVRTQLNYVQLAYEQIRACGRKAWWALPAKGDSEGVFSKCIQGPLESFSDFVARLTQAVRRQIQHEIAGDILIQQLAYENANDDCKKCLMPLRKGSTITEMIRACQNVGSGTFQANLLAAAITVKNKRCYNCGKTGHFRKECRQLRRTQGGAPGKGANIPPREPINTDPTSLCPRCQKGYHWASRCKSRFHKNGQPLNQDTGYGQPRGNGQRGHPQPCK
uniref:CCHC-type domain-containing protein n=1 Tax=Myotis myotis TaxID=51298 RepID=A0A7J7U557_MYOMY|nr:hypothetical protein mMyoMyo1_008816 [Myotis myotis]